MASAGGLGRRWQVTTRRDLEQLDKDARSCGLGSRAAALVVSIMDALREWSCHVQECVAWKMSNPCSEEDLVRQQVRRGGPRAPAGEEGGPRAPAGEEGRTLCASR